MKGSELTIQGNHFPPVQYANPRVEGEGEEEENEDGDDPPEGGDGGGHDPDGNDIVNMALNGVSIEWAGH